MTLFIERRAAYESRSADSVDVGREVEEALRAQEEPSDTFGNQDRRNDGQRLVVGTAAELMMPAAAEAEAAVLRDRL